MSKFKPNRQNSVPARSRPSKLAWEQSGQDRIADTGEPVEPTADPMPAGSVNEELPPNALQKMGFVTTLLFVFFRFSFAHEFIASKLHFNTHLIVLLGVLAYLSCILSGRMLRAFQEKSTWMWCGFLVCMTLATSLSFWKGGSFPLWIDYLETVFPIVLVLPALAVSKGQISKMISVIGLACITTVLLGGFNDDFKSGRMNIDAAGSDIQDPNDYAAHLILMLPALAFFALRAGRPIVFKLVGLAVFGLSLLQILSTGSRGGLLSLVISTAYIALIASKHVRIGILVGGPLAIMIALPFVPAESTARLSTLFSSSSGETGSEALDSKEARLTLLAESWKTTLQNPLVGVGPGIFMDYQADSAKEAGQRGLWHVTHNSYTQVSSECGLPALILYLSGLGITFFLLRRCSKSRDPEIATMALFVSVMLVGFCVCMFFLSLAYNVHILTISAIAVAMHLRLKADGTLPDEQNSQGLPVARPVHA